MSSALPEAENYHRWILDLLSPHLRGRVLEIGVGHGQYTAAIAARAEQVVGVDVTPECLQGTQFPSNVDLRVADLGAPDFAERAGEAAFDTAVCLNVLEHIRDDGLALRAILRSLKPGGTLFLFVPAHAALMGEMDRLAGHFRRYTRAPLVRLLEEAGYQGVRAAYFNSLGGIGWWLNAKLARPRGLSDPAVNRQILWFDRYVQPVSRRIDPLTRRFFGQSVWAVGRRP